MPWPWARDHDDGNSERRARRDRALARLEILVAQMQVTVAQMERLAEEQARRSDG